MSAAANMPAGHYRAIRRARERAVLNAALQLADVHQKNGTINAAARALQELRAAVAVLEGAERDARHDRAAPPVVERIPGDGCWVRLKFDGAEAPLHPDEARALYEALGRALA